MADLQGPGWLSDVDVPVCGEVAAGALPSSANNTIFTVTPDMETEPSKYGEAFRVYVESVLTLVAGLYQVSETMFVVQGWDMKRESALV